MVLRGVERGGSTREGEDGEEESVGRLRRAWRWDKESSGELEKEEEE